MTELQNRKEKKINTLEKFYDVKFSVEMYKKQNEELLESFYYYKIQQNWNPFLDNNEEDYIDSEEDEDSSGSSFLSSSDDSSSGSSSGSGSGSGSGTGPK